MIKHSTKFSCKLSSTVPNSVVNYQTQYKFSCKLSMPLSTRYVYINNISICISSILSQISSIKYGHRHHVY